MTSFWCDNGVIVAQCACWVAPLDARAHVEMVMANVVSNECHETALEGLVKHLFLAATKQLYE